MNYSILPIIVNVTHDAVVGSGLFVGYVTNEGTPYDDKRWYAATTLETSVVKAGYANGSLYFFSLVWNTYLSMAATTRTGVSDRYITNSFVGSNTGTTIYYYMRWSGSDYPDAYPGPAYFRDFSSEADLFAAIDDGSWDNQPVTYPITYRPTNCSFPNAPTEAAVGDTVTVPVAFEEGYGIVNPSDIYVTCNGVSVPSTYNNGTLTFTMPDPS